MVGVTFFLIVWGFASAMGAVALIVACWLANRILGPVTCEVLPDFKEAEDTVALRTVDAGPYTSPATAQASFAGKDALPLPEFWHAFGVAAVSLIVAYLLCASSFVVLPNEALWQVTLILALAGSATIHLCFLVNVLSTTWPKAMLVLLLELVPFFVLVVLPIGSLIATMMCCSDVPRLPVTALLP